MPSLFFLEDLPLEKVVSKESKYLQIQTNNNTI